jgi:hypothetical protein
MKIKKITYQSLWDRAMAVGRGRFIAMSTYIKTKTETKTKIPQINSLMMHSSSWKNKNKLNPKLRMEGNNKDKSRN